MLDAGLQTWEEFWSGTSVLSVVGWVIGVVALVGFFIKGWPRIKAFVAFIDALFSLPKFIVDSAQFREETKGSIDAIQGTLAAQDRKIAEIHHEVNYNNGSSVKDAVERVELGVKGLYDRIDTTDKNAADLRSDLEETRPHAPARKRAAKP